MCNMLNRMLQNSPGASFLFRAASPSASLKVSNNLWINFVHLEVVKMNKVEPFGLD